MSRDFSENDTRKRNDLKTYYGIEAKTENTLNIDGKDFDSEIYVDKLVKVRKIFNQFILQLITLFLMSRNQI